MMSADASRTDPVDRDVDRRVRALVWADPGLEPPVRSLDPRLVGVEADLPSLPLVVLVPVLDQKASNRFWSKVVVDANDCWQWTASLRDGYGRFHLNGRYVPSHRITYEFFIGPIPEGLQIDHLCRNRACCNPAHLEAVTQRENILRGTSPAALHAKKTHCAQGHPYSLANTRIRSTGQRVCLTCDRKWDREKHRRQRASE